MPQRKRKQREHTEDWQIIKQYTLFSEQQAYELLASYLFGILVVCHIMLFSRVWTKYFRNESIKSRDIVTELC